MASVQQPLPPVLNSGQRRTGLTRVCLISGGVSQIPPSELTLPWQPPQTLFGVFGNTTPRVGLLTHGGSGWVVRTGVCLQVARAE